MRAAILMTGFIATCAPAHAQTLPAACNSHTAAITGGPLPPRNPFLADSAYPIGHTNSGQVDSTLVPGPTAPSHRLAADEMEFLRTGPGHLANIVGPAYPDGSRPIWSNNAQDIVKSRVRLHIIDGFKLIYDGGPLDKRPDARVPHEAVYATTDPVAMDVIGQQEVERWRKEKGLPSLARARRDPSYIRVAGELGLGIADLNQIRLREITL